jgi:uncharacterized protein (UPF0335 family)
MAAAPLRDFARRRAAASLRAAQPSRRYHRGQRGASALSRFHATRGNIMDDAAFQTESIAADQLKAFIERIERLEEEKAGIAGDIKEVYAEAKGSGFDTKVIRKIISMRKKDYAERQEEEAILELYMQALGMAA